MAAAINDAAIAMEFLHERASFLLEQVMRLDSTQAKTANLGSNPTSTGIGATFVDAVMNEAAIQMEYQHGRVAAAVNHWWPATMANFGLNPTSTGIGTVSREVLLAYCSADQFVAKKECARAMGSAAIQGSPASVLVDHLVKLGVII